MKLILCLKHQVGLNRLKILGGEFILWLTRYMRRGTNSLVLIIALGDKFWTD